jgi:trans-aconitate methyltransferase
LVDQWKVPSVKASPRFGNDVTQSVTDLWNATYEAKSMDQRSWSQDVATDSLAYVESIRLALNAAVIDIGGGSSPLVNELLARSFTDLTVLDISRSAMEEARERVGDGHVTWLLEDITTWTPIRKYSLWHDRAVFHFLVRRSQQRDYVKKAALAVIPGGHVLLATFAPSGPDECSGLAVQRWSDHELEDLFSKDFKLVTSAQIDHVTPWGSVQPFTWVLLEHRTD